MASVLPPINTDTGVALLCLKKQQYASGHFTFPFCLLRPKQLSTIHQTSLLATHSGVLPKSNFFARRFCSRLLRLGRSQATRHRQKSSWSLNQEAVRSCETVCSGKVSYLTQPPLCPLPLAVCQPLGPAFLDPKVSRWGTTEGACARMPGCHMSPRRQARAPSVGPHPGALGRRIWSQGLAT